MLFHPVYEYFPEEEARTGGGGVGRVGVNLHIEQRGLRVRFSMARYPPFTPFSFSFLTFRYLFHRYNPVFSLLIRTRRTCRLSTSTLSCMRHCSRGAEGRIRRRVTSTSRGIFDQACIARSMGSASLERERDEDGCCVVDMNNI